MNTFQKSFVWAGTWNALTRYLARRVVHHDGAAYVSLLANTGVTPGTDPTIWDLFAAGGEVGPQGGVGPAGADGTDGANGATWRSGAGVPSNALGVDGDFYLDTATSNVYKRAAGAYALDTNIKGAQGIQGEQGSPGEGLILRGPYDPLATYTYGEAVSYNGASYAAKGTLAPGTTPVEGPDWFLVADQGPQGPTGDTGTAGATWRTGAGAPDNGTGVDGDLYLDTTSGEVYKRAAGAYAVQADITGPAGADGAPGAAGVASGVRQTVLAAKTDSAGAPAFLLGLPYLKADNITSSAQAISGGDNASWPASNAFDRDRSTRWQSSQTGTAISGAASIGQHFSSAVSIRTILVYTGASSANNIPSAKVQTSSDGSAWTDEGTYALSTTGDGINRLSLSATPGAKLYWRVLANANLAAGQVWDVREVAMSESTTFGTEIDLLASPTEPCVLSFSAGSDSTGILEHIETLDDDQVAAWDSGNLTNSATNYLYAERDSGGNVTFGATTTAPVYQPGSTPVASTHTFDYTRYIMYNQAGATVQRLFLGECAVDASGNITSVTPYALQGKWDSGAFSIAAATLYVKSHNLGVIPLVTVADGSGGATGIGTPIQLWYNAAVKGASLGAIGRLSASLRVNTTDVYGTDGSLGSISNARIRVFRGW